MKSLSARLAAAAGLTLLFGSAALAQMAPPAAPAAPATAPTTGKSHMVKAHIRTLKSGKMVIVKAHMSKAPTKKMMKKM